MKIKKFILAGLAVWVTFQITDFLGHSLWLGPTYKELASIWRPDMMDKMWIFSVIGFIGSFLFVYIYTKGYEGKGICEGVRYGVIIGLFIAIPAAFSSYAMYPLPLSLCIKWFVLMMAQYIICGAVAALIYCGWTCCCGKNK